MFQPREDARQKFRDTDVLGGGAIASKAKQGGSHDVKSALGVAASAGITAIGTRLHHLRLPPPGNCALV